MSSRTAATVVTFVVVLAFWLTLLLALVPRWLSP